MTRSLAVRLDTLPPRWAAVLLLLASLALYLPGLATLPPMDRDEPRFAQASKQMLETGDVVSIRFQDEARNKKPVGIYWLQAASVALGDALGVPDARRTIWLYRMPSLLGAMAAVLATYWTALAFAGRRAALLGALLFASTLILTVESHLAKTDAVLCATVVVAMGALLRLYLPARTGLPPPPGWRLPAVFWTAIAVGILVKGPITPMVPAFAIIVLAVAQRSVGWLRALRPGYGLLWVLLLVLPWLVLILVRTHGAFLADSLGHDMLGKVGGAQESHGAPPGTYLVAFWITAWPLAPFAALAATGAWRRRREPAVAFLLAWIVPTWLLFEIVSTKLPHYVLPAYPAIGILTALVLSAPSETRVRGRFGVGLVFVLLALLPVGLAAVLGAGGGYLWTTLSPGTVAAGALVSILGIAAAAGAARLVGQGRIPAAVSVTTGLALLIYGFVLGHLLTPGTAPLLSLSARLAAAERTVADPTCPMHATATVGDHEPSLVFLTGTDLLLTNAQGAADFLKLGDCRVALVERRAEPGFLAALAAMPEVRLATRIVGTAINGGKHLDIGIYVRQRSAP